MVDKDLLKRIKNHVANGQSCFYLKTDGTSVLLSHTILDRPFKILPWPLSLLQKMAGAFTIRLMTCGPRFSNSKETVFSWKDFNKAIEQFLSHVENPLLIQFQGLYS